MKNATDDTPSTTFRYGVEGDVLCGAAAIGRFLFGANAKRRTVYNLVEKKRIPHFRIGTSLCARKSVLLAWIAEQERDALR
jgi:excisionase family DNA binding protein